LQNVANSLPDVFIDYKGVMKSWNPAVNVHKRVEVTKKTTHASYTKKKWRVATTTKDNALEKLPRKKTRAPRKIVNVSQPMVE
jgi:hypothetical protein